MIRTETALDTRSLDTLIARVQNPAPLVQRASTRAFAEPSGKAALVSSRYLGAEPGPAPHPFVWSTDATKNANARRMYHYLINAGLIKTDGERYIRTHDLSQGYDGGVFMDGLNVMISITNKANKAHLYAKGRRQVVSHQHWGHDAPVVAQWLADWRPTLVQAVREAFAAPG